ncbi:MAG: GNAT family N-acetyltransferase [Deltaproteobacteria bacterium]|nr:GNAT family N-acetyltransferase [Deltaproteobacteria bacterium]MBW2122053.1 GNAT family N-acetyltransferase [Deltaproteobacteria bacterium]
MPQSVSEEIRIRPMREDDLEAVVAIDEKVLGEKRYDYWRRKIRFRGDNSDSTGFVAEAEGRIVGFILGEISGREFRISHTVGWVDTIGVDPAYQRRGVASALLDRVIRCFKEQGVETIHTLVNWSSWDLLQFYKKAGFTRGDMINLELKI